MLGFVQMQNVRPSKVEFGHRAVAIYHLVYAHEGFDESAKALWKLLQEAQLHQPGKRRILYLDIESHRDDQGTFDADMLELQRNFLVECLGPYLSEIHTPLLNATRTEPQENDIPPSLVIQGSRDEKQK